MMWTNEKNSAFRFSLTFCGIKHLISVRYKSVPVFTNDTSNLFSFHNFQHTYTHTEREININNSKRCICICTMHEYWIAAARVFEWRWDFDGECISCTHIKWQVAFWMVASSVWKKHKMKETSRNEKKEREKTWFLEPQNCFRCTHPIFTSRIHNNWSHVNEAKFSH